MWLSGENVGGGRLVLSPGDLGKDSGALVPNHALRELNLRFLSLALVLGLGLGLRVNLHPKYLLSMPSLYLSPPPVECAFLVRPP